MHTNGTTTTPTLLPPPGAQWADELVDAYRVCGNDRAVDGHPARVRATCCQRADGTVAGPGAATGSVSLSPEIVVYDAENYPGLTAAQARELALNLLGAAIDVDVWSRTSATGAVTAVAALRGAAGALRQASASAGDAADMLPGGGAHGRAVQLQRGVKDLIALADRLIFALEAQHSSDQHEQQLNGGGER
jgi:hypothetical protein